MARWKLTEAHYLFGYPPDLEEVEWEYKEVDRLTGRGFAGVLFNAGQEYLRSDRVVRLLYRLTVTAHAHGAGCAQQFNGALPE